MKKVKMVMMIIVVGLFYSCSKSDHLEPLQLQDNPHKRDTIVNNTIPKIVLANH